MASAAAASTASSSAAAAAANHGDDTITNNNTSRENFTWWHRHIRSKNTSNTQQQRRRPLPDSADDHGSVSGSGTGTGSGSYNSRLYRSASQDHDHTCGSTSTSNGTRKTSGMMFGTHGRSPRSPRSVGSSPLSARHRIRVFGCTSALPTLDSDYQIADATAEVTPAVTPTKPVKKQKLWRNIKFTTSVIRMGSKSDVASDSLSTSAPELNRSSKQVAAAAAAAPSTTSDSQKESSNAEEKRVPKVDEYVTFHVKIRLKDGKNLAVRDASGSSDPYVKFKYKNRTYFKSNTVYKNLNPVWEEEFSQLIDDPTTPISLSVYDYDRFAADDYMGGGIVDVSQLRLFQPTELKVKLAEDGKADEMGEVNLVVTVTPLTQTEKEQFMKKCVRGITSEQLKRPQKVSQVWSSVVNIVLIEGHDLISPINSTSLPDPFVKFKLGSEKYKSKPASRTRNPKWLEQFDLHMYDEPVHILELMVNDKRNNGCLGTYHIDLDKLEKESANQMRCELENGGSILLLISISGTTSTDAVVDLCEFTGNDVRNAIVNKYNILRTFNSIRDIGYLTVKVFQARDLMAADMVGKSDPFVVVELVNARLQTHTEYKTINPTWNKLFTLSVKDIHSVLEVTVYDEDPNKKAGFLGKVVIPLLKIKNCEKRWYALKNRKLDQPSKGQIELELDVIWNPVRAAIRTFNPREEKYMQSEPKFKRQVFMHNYSRLKNSLLCAIEVHDFVQSCFNWDSPKRSMIAFMIYLVSVYFFELYHIPLCILALFLRAYISHCYNSSGLETAQQDSLPGDSFEDDETNEQEVKPAKLKQQASVHQSKDGERSSATLKDRLSAIQETLAMVQNTMDFIASLLERVKNTFNFTQRYLSVLAIVVLSIATVLLYVIPLRWILIAWGINKFTKKLRNPNFIPNNELLDFLSRVPSDAEIKAYEELQIDEKLCAQLSTESSSAATKKT